MKKPLVLFCALLAAAVFSACGSDDSTVVASGGEPAAPQSDRLDATIRSSDAVGVTLTPPDDADEASVSSDQAGAAVTKVFGPEAAKDLTPKLAILNNRVMGDIQEDGTVEPYYVNRLVWAFIGYETCAPLSRSLAGGIGRKVTPTTVGGPVACIGVLTVDAATGEYLMGYTAARDAYEMEQRGIQEKANTE